MFSIKNLFNPSDTLKQTQRLLKIREKINNLDTEQLKKIFEKNSSYFIISLSQDLSCNTVFDDNLKDFFSKYDTVSCVGHTSLFLSKNCIEQKDDTIFIGRDNIGLIFVKEKSSQIYTKSYYYNTINSYGDNIYKILVEKFALNTIALSVSEKEVDNWFNNHLI